MSEIKKKKKRNKRWTREDGKKVYDVTIIYPLVLPRSLTFSPLSVSPHGALD